MSKCIVFCRNDGPRQLSHVENTPKAGVLMVGNFVTVFPNRSAARQAIKRTVEYAEQEGLKMWPKLWEYIVCNLDEGGNKQ
jgi:hypothetical protein